MKLSEGPSRVLDFPMEVVGTVLLSTYIEESYAVR